jgi:hypothetical protein
MRSCELLSRGKQDASPPTPTLLLLPLRCAIFQVLGYGTSTAPYGDLLDGGLAESLGPGAGTVGEATWEGGEEA